MPPTPNAPDFTWFEVIDDGSPYECPGELQACPDPGSGPEPDSVSSFGLAIAQDSLSFTEAFDEAIKETLKRHLYRLLDDYPALIDQDSALLLLHSVKDTSAAGAFTAIERLKSAIFTMDSADMAQLALWETAIGERLDSLYFAEEQLPPDVDSSAIAQFAGFQVALLGEIDSLLRLQRQIACEDWPAKIALADSALTLNSAIQAATLMETNEKTVNQIYLEKGVYGNFDFDTSEKNLLDSIANQCPTLGGDAVFKARGMLAATGWEACFNDDSLCQFAEMRAIKQSPQAVLTPSPITVFPNPATERVIIQIPGQKNGKTVLNITDMLGNTLVHKTLGENTADTATVEIALADLPAGMCVLHLYSNGQKIGSKKLVIIK